MTDSAVSVVDVAKHFRLVHSRNSTLKATIFNGFRRTEFEEFWALDGIDLEIPEGSTYGLIGHNGSGKSTLLKCIAKIYRPTRGEITTRGQVTALLELGAGFHPELSGRENVYLNGSILGLSKRDIDGRFDDIVGFAGLERFIDSPVKNYSSGMFVRLGFSVAISVEPDVLLVDEVLSVGDESFQQRCLQKFSELRRDGRTVVVVSHGLETVRDLCDQAAWLDHGTLCTTGPAGLVVDAYLESVRVQERSRRAAFQRTGDESVPIQDSWQMQPLELGHDGRVVDVLRHDDPFRAGVAVWLPHDGVTVRLSVVRTDGVHVAEVRAKLEPGGMGESLVCFEAPALPVAPGTYQLVASLADGWDQVDYLTSPATTFDVVARDEHARTGGILALQGGWEAKGLGRIQVEATPKG